MSKELFHLTTSYLDDLIKEIENKEQTENMVRMNFEVPESLRNAFKAKTASQGRKVKHVLAAFMAGYIKTTD